MRDFEVKNAKIFPPNFPQTPPNNEEGDTPSSNSSPQCRENSNLLSFIPRQRILDPSLDTFTSTSDYVLNRKFTWIFEVTQTW